MYLALCGAAIKILVDGTLVWREAVFSRWDSSYTEKFSPLPFITIFETGF
jgi:hypothetical protein